MYVHICVYIYIYIYIYIIVYGMSKSLPYFCSTYTFTYSHFHSQVLAKMKSRGFSPDQDTCNSLRKLLCVYCVYVRTCVCVCVCVHFLLTKILATHCVSCNGHLSTYIYIYIHTQTYKFHMSTFAQI